MSKKEIVIPEKLQKKSQKFSNAHDNIPIDMAHGHGKVFWQVAVGDKVKKGDLLCELEVFKNIGELHSEVDGTVVEIIVENGQECLGGTVIGIIDEG